MTVPMITVPMITVPMITEIMLPRKRFGQHWLKSDSILEQIITAAKLEPGDRLLEIGPGTGILTRRLLPEIEALVSVEIDRDLCEKLIKKFQKNDNFLLLQGDILSLELEELLTKFPKFQHPQKVVANIPYNITGPIIEKLLGTINQPNPHPYQLIVLLIQKEVAQRLTASPGNKIYGALSVKVQYLAQCELICDVPAKAFYPPPKVDSAVVRLTPRPYPLIAENLQFLETLVKLGFANKRKMLKNNLKGIFNEEIMVECLTEKLNLNSQVRAEELSLDDWIKLSNQLK
jgi:16S rRNA (adenine1518-N6/adenine1519-N6)-dimethyltransferase